MPANIDMLINGKDMTAPAVNSAKGGLRSLGNEAAATQSKFNAMTVAVGTVVGNLATSAITKMGEMAASIVTTGVGFNNMKQQADIAFTTMLGSGEKAQAFLDKLQAFAAKTPFEFPDLLMASQRMLAMGIQSDKVLPTLTAIGDAVAGLGGSSAMVDRVTTALGQMQAKGKATGEEMMQLTEAGIPAWEFLAKKIGVSIPEAMKMVEKGAVSADVAIGALVEGMNTKFGGMMEKQSKTFGGLWSTIKDTFGQISGQVMQPLFDMMTRGLQMIVDFTNSPSFSAGVKVFAGWMETAAGWFGLFFDKVQAGHPIFLAFMSTVHAMLPESLLDTWWGFIDVISTTTRFIKSLFTEVRRFEDDTPMITYLLDLGDMARKTFGYLFEQAGKIILRFIQWSGSVMPPLIEGAAKFFDHLGMMVDAVKAVFKPVGDAITRLVKLEDVFSALALMLTGPVLSAVGAVIGILGAPILAQIAAVTAAVAAMRYAWQNDLGGIRTFTQSTVQKISDWFFKESGIWKGNWEETWEYIAKRVKNFITLDIPNTIMSGLAIARSHMVVWSVAAKNRFAEWSQDVKDTISDWKNTTERWYTEWKDRVIGFFQKTFGPIIKEISDWAIVTESTIQRWIGLRIKDFTDWKDDMLDLFQPVFDWWKEHVDPWIQYGIDIVQGLWDGMKDIWNDLSDWFTGVWGDLTDRFKRFFGIASPSALFASYGRFMMEGLAGGIAEHQSVVAAEIASLSNSVTAQMERLKGAVVQKTVDIASLIKQANPNNAPVIGVIPGTNGGTVLLGPVPGTGGVTTPAMTAPKAPTTTIGSAIGGISTGATGQDLLGGISVATPDIAGANASAKGAAAKVKEFIAGLNDFLAATVDNRTMSKVFQTLDSKNTGISELRAADEKIRTVMADLLGVDFLYGRLSDSLAGVMNKVSAGTDLNKVANLLQSAVDFRTLANHFSTSDYADVLPTDKRLTGGNQTTNNYTITLQGSNNANADVLGLVQLLGSLQGSVAP